jgi:hypothetical protein
MGGGPVASGGIRIRDLADDTRAFCGSWPMASAKQ